MRKAKTTNSVRSIRFRALRTAILAACLAASASPVAAQSGSEFNSG